MQKAKFCGSEKSLSSCEFVKQKITRICGVDSVSLHEFFTEPFLLCGSISQQEKLRQNLRNFKDATVAKIFTLVAPLFKHILEKTFVLRFNRDKKSFVQNLPD